MTIDIQVTFTGHSGYIPGTFKWNFGDIQVILMGYSFGFKVHIEPIWFHPNFFDQKFFDQKIFASNFFQGTFRRHLENIDMTLELHSSYIKVTFRLYSAHIHIESWVSTATRQLFIPKLFPKKFWLQNFVEPQIFWP